MEIICPSRHRDKIFMTNITDMIILVDEIELDNYKRANLGFRIETHPSLKSLSAIRQYAYEKWGDVFFVDDDIVQIEELYGDADQLTPDQARDLIHKTYWQAKQIGASLYGFNNDPSLTHFNQHKPFMLNGYINGCAFGLNKDSHLYFDKRTVACESHWINLLNAYYNRFCFIDKRFHFRQKKDSTFFLEGGQSGKRTLQSEKADTLFLRRMFGDSVKLKKAKNKTLQLHEYQRCLNIKL